MRFPKISPFLALIAVTAAPARGHDVNGYAVAAHRRCGSSNLPATIPELTKFFASPHFPDDARKNVFWSNEQVKASEWMKEGDYFQNSAAAGGFDGADSSLLTYIASHGMTSRGRYVATAGGSGGSCRIESQGMALGDQKARYLILSTCEGLKIGTGYDPAASGENPSRTWEQPAQGLNCIFGYSNVMRDDDQYGAYLLENLATSDDTLAEAFFKASRRVSYDNIPAALCFGKDEASARQNLAGARRFTADRFGKGASVWVYDQPQKRPDAFQWTMSSAARGLVPRQLGVKPRAVDPLPLAKALFGRKVEDIGVSSQLGVYRVGSATLTHQRGASVLSWSKGKNHLGTAMRLSDELAIRISQDFLRSKGIVADPEGELMITYVVSRGTRLEGRTAVVAKTIVFHQRLHGLTPLAGAGSVEVTVDAAGEVVGFQTALVDVALSGEPQWLERGSIQEQSVVQAARERLAARLGEASLTVVDVRVGYDLGDRVTVGAKAPLVAEVVFEAEGGGFKRRFAEKIAL